MHEIIRLERQGWVALTSDAASQFYDRLLTSEALLVVPGAVLNREQVLASWRQAPPWLEHRLDDERVVELAPGVALLVYRATARRAGQTDPYRAILASLYVGGPDAWRLAFHQQTPL